MFAFLMKIFNDILGKVSKFVDIFVVFLIKRCKVGASGVCHRRVYHDIIYSNRKSLPSKPFTDQILNASKKFFGDLGSQLDPYSMNEQS